MRYIDPQPGNDLVLNLTQALLRVISCNFRAIWIAGEADLSVHFLLVKEDPLDREEIEDAQFELLALQTEFRDVDFFVHVSDAPLAGVLPKDCRGVFLRREGA